MEQAARSRAHGNDPWSPWNSGNAWRLNEPAVHSGGIILNGQDYEVPVEEIGTERQRRFRITVGDKSVVASGELVGNELFSDIDGHRRRLMVVPDGKQFTLFTETGALTFSMRQPDYGEADAGAGQGAFSAPMTGIVVKTLAEPGTAVAKDQPLIIMEAMKMEHTLCAPADGTVDEFYFKSGDQVEGGASLLSFIPKKQRNKEN
jgi:3-methylcrotonyl-CoA carboxylase alpha subunit